MHVNVICPSCHNRYQVEPSLCGLRIRCPNEGCREVFEVRADGNAGDSMNTTMPPQTSGDASGPGPAIIEGVPLEEPDAGPVRGGTNTVVGHVQDFVPVLTGVNAGGVAPKNPADSSSWRQAPPPLRNPQGGTNRSGDSAVEPPPSSSPDWRSLPPRPRTTPSPAGDSTSSQKSSSNRGSTTQDVSRSSSAGRGGDAASASNAKTSRESSSRKAAAPSKKSSDAPLELPPGAWEAPPVRRSGESAAVSPVEVPRQEEVGSTGVAKSKKSHRAWMVVAGIGAISFVVLGVTAVLVIQAWKESESNLEEQARRDYAEGRYSSAATAFKQLHDRFPESGKADEYKFLEEFSNLRSLGQSAMVDFAGAISQIENFIKNHRSDPLLKSYGGELGKTAVQIVKNFAVAVSTDSEKASLLASDELDRAKKLIADVNQLDNQWIPEGDRQEIADLFRKADELAAVAKRRKGVLDQLKQYAAHPSGDSIQVAKELIKQESAVLKGFEQDPKAQSLLQEMYAAHLASVKYTHQKVALKHLGQVEDVDPSLLVQPMTAGTGAELPGNRVVLALVRGVLYALQQNTGEVVWAMRVGIDTATLPVRLPAAGGNPEMVLVLSADTETLTALSARTGEQLWKYRLSAPCLSRPLIVDLRAYVPTYDGQVHEIELAQGHLLGRYSLGQRLSVGGAHLPGTSLVFFPADNYCTYVLDVDAKRCQSILYSEHMSGSLRSPPIIAVRSADSSRGGPIDSYQGYLILNQTSGLDAMRLRTYGLPLQGANAQQVPMQEPLVHGWSWFPPYQDAEKLVTVTDAGVLGLFGLQQLHNQDQPLYPLVRERDKQTPGVVQLAGSNASRGRAQVVHVQEEDFWVLAHGKLQRLQLVFDRRVGPKVLHLWSPSKCPSLGSALHESQVDENGSTLFLVTQLADCQTCLATAVEAESGKILWQRQLGLVCQGDPLALSQEVLTLDQGGGLFLFDAKKHPEKSNVQWQSGGFSLAKPLEGGLNGRQYLLPGRDGRFAYDILTGADSKMIVREYQVREDGKRGMVKEQAVELPAALAGAPAVGASSLYLPLANGSLMRIALPLDETAAVAGGGPDWRASTFSDAETPGYVTPLDGDDFLTTNGKNGLTYWNWRGAVWTSIPPGNDAQNPTVKLRDRIIAPPVVLPPTKGGSPLSVCVADSQGVVHLFTGKDLAAQRRWDLKGKITSGPFLRGRYIGCVVDRRRLVWLDPDDSPRDPLNAQPLWTYQTQGESILGQPQIIEELLVVADQSGRFVGLDPATGQPSGPAYTLKASVAPAAAPAPFGSGRAFAPLTDGTVLLLSLKHLRGPMFRSFPTFW